MWRVERRPWGWFATLANTRRWWIKVLRVRGRTSLQKHAQRRELHIGTSGIAYVGLNQEHRLGPGLHLELAWGWVDESDIVRLDDDYGRIP